uniref:Uncharacterized protein n=1 Tax=Anguilla anguilla TaxID=7936 RepID=A0A0E9QNH3_ANGAN
MVSSEHQLGYPPDKKHHNLTD